VASANDTTTMTRKRRTSIRTAALCVDLGDSQPVTRPLHPLGLLSLPAAAKSGLAQLVFMARRYSVDEEDATSWDGGDDEEEAEQMELDDDEEDAVDEASEEDDEPQSLVVTLRYGKGATASSSSPTHDTTMANGVDHLSISSTGAPAPQHAVPVISNGVSAPTQEVYTAPVVHAAHQQPPVGNADALPQLDGFFSAPTPPYTAPEEAPKPHQPVAVPTNHAGWQ
jgi:hypothetical protein